MILNMFMGPEPAKKAVEEAGKAADAAAAAGPAAKQAAASVPLETANPWAMPTEASHFAGDIDSLYFFIVALDAFFFVLVIGAMVYFMWKYRRRSKDQKTSSITHSGKIEFLWSAIPAVLLVVIFVWGEYDFVKQSVPPADALDVKVTGRKWYWTVQYPQYPGVILTSNVDEPQVTILLPKDRPVRFTMTAEDVLHSFYIPAFRIKRDAVPGRYTQMWATPTVVGEFNVFCAEYCGDFHSKMTGIAKVMPPELFEDAIKEAGKLEQEEGESLVDFGQRIYSRRGCNACHSLDGTPGTGPTWQGLWGRTETLQDGSSITIDGEAGMNYIRESILDPNAKLVSGFSGGMPSFQGQLDDKQIDAVIEFIKTLK